MNSKNINNIYDMSKKIEAEDKQFEKEAKEIANAYRKVEQLKVAPLSYKQQTKKPKNQSAYALKVKETLKEINANKTKEMQSIAKYINDRTANVPTPPISKLHRAAATKILNMLGAFNSRISQASLRQILRHCQEEEAKEAHFIYKYNLFRLFKSWKNCIMQEKKHKQQSERQNAIIDLKSLELAKQFHIFLLLKKSFKFWQQDTNREKRRKAYQKQIINLQIKKEKIQPLQNQNKKIEENSQLQSKVRGFLDGLKQKIAQKDRLNTIKQKTEESKLPQNSEGANSIQNENGESSDLIDNDRQMIVEEEIIIQPPSVQPQEKKPMTNEDLERKRKQLEAKHKNRKETYERLKKEREEKKKEEERQRMEIQRQIELEQKRMKQEKYKQYLKCKQEQQAWEIKEKQLTTLADHFNRSRLIRYYGWLPWTSIKQRMKQNVLLLQQALVMIIYRIKGKEFIQNLEIVASQKLQNQLKNMHQKYCKKLLKKCFQSIKTNSKNEIQQKQTYQIMHDVNTLKIVFKGWIRIRNLIAQQNYDWQIPRNKRGQQFYQVQLKHKVIQSLKINKQQSKKERCLEQQKLKIKNKIKAMVEQNEGFDYQEYL